MFSSPREIRLRHCGGASLIEILVTMAVTSFGLLGLATLMGVSARVNQAAYQRTQVELIAQTLIDSMHVNPTAIAAGAYDGKLSSTDAAPDCLASGCDPDMRAKFDRRRFQRSIADVVPNAKSDVACKAGEVPLVLGNYDGSCRLEVRWPGRETSRDSKPQSLAWVFQP